MLRALNLRSTLITDGRTPINLLGATTGLIGQAESVIHGSVTPGSASEHGNAASDV
ncbi:unnamed protein product [Mesocestoides corti]|uniref:Iron-containing alcohol dehydrogenase n=1 Tax=Mesocestoides corti TaxID=53468 RepID=A0A0R3UDS0_MESCO|nr:unnamed protein product [Mesocestoides corti]